MRYSSIILYIIFSIGPCFATDFYEIGSDITKLPENITVFQKNTDAPKVSLAEYRGKKAVLLYFLKPGCGSCDKFSPHLYRLMLKNKKDLAVIGVSGLKDSPLEDIRDFANHCLGSYPVIYDPSHNFVDKLIGKIDKFPYVAIIGKDGKLEWFGRGKFHAQVTEQLKRVLGKDTEQSPAKPERQFALSVKGPVNNNQQTIEKSAKLAASAFTGYSDVYELLQQSESTTSNVRTKFTEIAAKATAKDSVVFYFTGNARAEVISSEKYDLALNLTDGKLKLSTMQQILEKNSKCKNVLFIIDSNHVDNGLDVWEDIAPKLKNQFSGISIILSSARWDHSNFDSATGVSLFAEYFHSGMEDKNASGSASALWRYIRDKMSNWSRSSGVLQSPFIVNGNIGNFILHSTKQVASENK